MKPVVRSLSLLLCALVSSSLADGTLSVDAPGYAAQNGDYTTSHVYIDEVAGTTADITFTFTPPGGGQVDRVELFTNLNRRDLARTDKNGDNRPDGVVPIDGNAITSTAADTDPVTGHYYAAFPMTYDAGSNSYKLTVPAAKTGAYRATARYRVNSGDAWTWYGLRDHALVVSPASARDINLYEMNVFNIEADGDQFANRSTIEDLHNALGAAHNTNNRWDLDYLLDLGCNHLWFQPIHPNADDGQEPTGGYGTNTPPYDPGSPYAVKNFFEVNELMSVNYDGSKTTAENRATAMTAWQNFVAAADTKGVGIMLDAPFNHTAFDVELAQQGVDLFQHDGATWSPTDEIRSRDARFFAQDSNGPDTAGGENYGNRASSAETIALGPDRFDFGKFRDTKEVFFGRYDALVEVDSEPERSSYTSEGDWFDYSDTDWTSDDFQQGGIDYNITQRVWDYFAEYALHWLEKTRPAGQNRNSLPSDGDLAARYAWDDRGIDSLRCDFGQGLPPRAWEYIINVARSKKWNFIMMAESLDGGAVTYRSGRHFDILNENIVFPLASAANKQDYRNIYEGRRAAYGQALVLSNTTSHDEESYVDPWHAVIRTSVTTTIDGLPLIFPGQELGISRTFGYQHYESNFGKEIPHFKRWNSLNPVRDPNNRTFGLDQLDNVYAGMFRAREKSPALRASNRYFFDGDGNNSQIHSVAKYETGNASPAFSDVVLAFSNLDRDNDQADNFKIPSPLISLLGLKSGRTYNAKNIAAYNRAPAVTGRDDTWLWGSGYTASDLESNGVFVGLKKVPDTDAAWDNDPFEAQFLKVYDVTPPPSPAPEADYYQLGTEVTFTWAPNGGPDDNVIAYQVTVLDENHSTVTTATVTDGSNSFTFTGTPGTTYRAVITAVSAAEISSTSPAASDTGEPNPASPNTSTVLLTLTGDEDHDGQSNTDEQIAGTNPLAADSFLAITNIDRDGSTTIITVSSVAGRYYHLQSSPTLAATSWTNVESNKLAAGASFDFVHTPSAPDRLFYRVIVTEEPIVE